MQDEIRSRRGVLKSGAALIAGSAAGDALPGRAVAQTAPDPAELTRLQRARRILLKGGIVLTLDRTIGDFAQGDVLIQDGKIRAVRPGIAAADAFVVDAANRIVIPGFIDTHSHSYQGLLRSLLMLVTTPGITHVACAFDHVIESFRNGLYPGYKTGAGVDSNLIAQFSLAEEAVSALGLVVWPMVEFEADDALSSATARFKNEAEVEQIVICSPDGAITARLPFGSSNW